MRELLLVFTSKSVEEMKRVGGTQSWKLNPVRARQCEYVVMCRNAHNPEGWADGRGPHGSAFMVGRIADVVPSRENLGRWLVMFSEYALVDAPSLWDGSHNPVRYTETIPFVIDQLQFEPMPVPEALETLSVNADGGSQKKMTIEDAKRGLAATFGVKPEAVEITIRG